MSIALRVLITAAILCAISGGLIEKNDPPGNIWTLTIILGTFVVSMIAMIVALLMLVWS